MTLPELPIKWIVCGGRNGSVARGLTKTRVWKVLDDMYANLLIAHTESDVVLTIVHGNAKWTDSWAGEWARMRGHGEIACPIDDDIDGVEWSCGRNRNKRMYAEHKDAERLIGFPGGGGTNHMMGYCQDRGIPVAEVELLPNTYRVRWWPQK